MFQTKSVEKIEARILYSTTFPKILPFMRQRGNTYMLEPGRPQMIMRYGRKNPLPRAVVVN